MPRFKKIFLEITNRCNLACDFCAPGHRVSADLSGSECAVLLPQLKEFTDYLALHVLGEPLLHPELDEILALCQRRELKVNLTTNGTLLPTAGGMLLASPALRQVNISLHSVMGRATGYDPETYLAEVLSFSQAAAGAGIFVSLRLWDRPRQMDGSRRWQEGVLARLEEFFAIAAPLSDLVDGGQGLCLSARIFLSRKQLFAWPDPADPVRSEQGFCLGLRDQVAILADGTVVPCCLDAEGQIPLGNVFTEPFGRIVTGERADRIRRGFQQRQVVEELCRRCAYRERF